MKGFNLNIQLFAQRATTSASVQTLFDSALIAFMAELKANQLKKLCHQKTQKGGDKITFYKNEKSSAQKSADGEIPSMFDPANTTANGGAIRKIEVEIGQIFYQDKVTEVEMNRTQIDIKSAFVVSMGNGLARTEDAEVIGAIEDAITNFTGTAGDSSLQKPKVKDLTASGNIAVEAVVKSLIATIRKATALAKFTVAPESYKGVSVILNSNNWAELSTSEYLLNSDYDKALTMGSKDTPAMFCGAEIFIDDDLDDNTVYVVPSGCMCWAEWEASVKGDAIFFPTDGRRWHLQGVKSVGCKVSDGARITKITVADPTVLG